MAQHGLYRFTSIGRPLDPRYPTNRAVQVLMPIAALVGGGVAWFGGVDAKGIAFAALGGLLVVFGCWALGRELAPDDNPGAFIGMAFAFAAFLLRTTRVCCFRSSRCFWFVSSIGAPV